MRGPYFTKTFYHFFFGFLAIVGVAFVVLSVAGNYTPKPVDNIALPQ